MKSEIERLDDLIANGKYEEAIKLIDKLIKTNKEYDYLKIEKIRLKGLIKRNEGYNAIEEVDELLKIKSKEVKYRSMIVSAIASLVAGTPFEAQFIDFYEAEFQEEANPYILYPYVIYAVEHEINIDKALAMIDELKDNEDFYYDDNIQFLLARLYLLNNQNEEARKIINKLIFNNADSFYINFLEGMYSEMTDGESIDKAIDYYLKTIDIYQDSYLISRVVTICKDNFDLTRSLSIIDEMSLPLYLKNQVKISIIETLGNLQDLVNFVNSEFDKCYDDIQTAREILVSVAFNGFIEGCQYEKVIDIAKYYYKLDHDNYPFCIYSLIELAPYELTKQVAFDLAKEEYETYERYDALMDMCDLWLNCKGEEELDTLKSHLNTLVNSNSEYLPSVCNIYRKVGFDEDHLNYVLKLTDSKNEYNNNVCLLFYIMYGLFHPVIPRKIVSNIISVIEHETIDHHHYCISAMIGRAYELINDKKTAFLCYQIAYEQFKQEHKINDCLCSVALYSYCVYFGVGCKENREEAIQIMKDNYLKYQNRKNYFSASFLLFLAYLVNIGEIDIDKQTMIDLLLLPDNFVANESSRFIMINRLAGKTIYDEEKCIREDNLSQSKSYVKRNYKKKDFVPFLMPN